MQSNNEISHNSKQSMAKRRDAKHLRDAKFKDKEKCCGGIDKKISNINCNKLNGNATVKIIPS